MKGSSDGSYRETAAGNSTIRNSFLEFCDRPSWALTIATPRGHETIPATTRSLVFPAATREPVTFKPRHQLWREDKREWPQSRVSRELRAHLTHIFPCRRRAHWGAEPRFQSATFRAMKSLISGSVTENVAPLSFPELSTRTAPPCSSTM